MDALLTSCDATSLAPTFAHLGVSSVEEVAACEVDDLVSDLGIDQDKARRIVEKAKQLQSFETRRKAAITDRWWEVVEDSPSVDVTKLLDIDSIIALDTRAEGKTFEGGCRFLLNWYKCSTNYE